MTARIRTNALLQVSLVFVTIAAVYVGTASYGGAGSPYQSKDTVTASLASWALAVHHTIDLGNHLTPTGRATLWLVPGAHGYLVSNRFPGAVLLALPLYWLAGGAYGGIPAGLTASIATAAAAAGMFVLLRRTYSVRIALGGAALLAFATANWSVSAKELWEHSGSELMIVAGMLAFGRRHWGWSGLAFGATILFRPHLGVGVAVLALGLLWTERRLGPVIRFGCGATFGLAAYLAWNEAVYGHFTLTGGYTSEVKSGGVGALGFLENLAGTIISPERGILICSPVFLLAIIGARRGWVQSTRYERLWAAAGLAYLVSQLWLIRYSGGSGFLGYRTCLEAIVWATPLLVRCGFVGAKRIGSGPSIALISASVAFFAAGMFLPNEVPGTPNPWTTYGPMLLYRAFGLGRLLEGAFIGIAGASVVFLALTRPIRFLNVSIQPSTDEADSAYGPGTASPRGPDESVRSTSTGARTEL